MIRILRATTVLLLFASVIACLVFSRFYLRRTADQFRSDFEHQNFAEISHADTYALTQRLNALSGSQSWRCISGRRNGAVFFQKGPNECRPGILERTLEITADSADGNIEMKFCLALPWEVRSALFVLMGIQLAILLTLLQITRKSDQFRHEAESRLVALSAQVSHDIRSPLAALVSIVQNSSDLEEGTRAQLRTAANRIRDIANQLLDKYREKNSGDRVAKASSRVSPGSLAMEKLEPQLLSAAIESVVTQKQLQYAHRQDIHLDPRIEQGYGLFGALDGTELSRVLSNLIDNAVEALVRPGQVIISLAEDRGRARIEIRDSGRGIPEDVLKKLGDRGVTHGKRGGSGLGVHHAKTTLESWGGSFKIESQMEVGTTVTLSIPKTEPPGWFVNTISWGGLKSIVVLDDDPSIHRIWESRFRQAGVPVSTPVICFKSSQEILAWFRENLGVIQQALFLCDQELIGSKLTGLEVIDLLGVASDSILVTNRFEERAIQERCEKLKIKLLPKTMAGLIPITEYFA